MIEYVDLTYGEGVLARFQERTKIVHSIRQTLKARDFCEIEGPTLPPCRSTRRPGKPLPVENRRQIR